MNEGKKAPTKAGKSVPGESARPGDVVQMPKALTLRSKVVAVTTEPDVREHELSFRTLTRAIKDGTATTGLASDISLGAKMQLCKIEMMFIRGKKQKAGTTSGGVKRAVQQKNLAVQRAQPIYDVYMQVLADGVPPHKAIAKTTENLQQTPRYNKITQRQVRRAVERVMKKDSC